MSNSQKIDLTGFSDSDINSLYRDAQRGVRRQGYDDSNDVTVDYDPLPQDAINAAKAVTSDWKGGAWDDVRDAVKHGYSEEDLIHKMRGAVSNEYLTRMEGRIDKNSNRELPKPEAPKAEAKKEEYKPRPKVEVELESIRPFEPESKPENKAKSQIDGFAGSSWNPEGGTEAPGMAEYGVAKAKAQSFQAKSKPDYSFNAGNYGSTAPEQGANYGAGTSAPPTSANSFGTDGIDAERDAQEMKNNYVQRIVTPVS